MHSQVLRERESKDKSGLHIKSPGQWKNEQ